MMPPRPRPDWQIIPADPATLASLPAPGDLDALAAWCYAREDLTGALGLRRHGRSLKPTIAELADAVVAGVIAYHSDTMGLELRETLALNLTCVGRTFMYRYGRPPVRQDGRPGAPLARRGKSGYNSDSPGQ
jgi:hypothetical protein